MLNDFVKFKIGSGGENAAILCNELRSVCDEVLLERLMGEGDKEKFDRVFCTLRTLLEAE